LSTATASQQNHATVGERDPIYVQRLALSPLLHKLGDGARFV
jgi:hypothetical protein